MTYQRLLEKLQKMDKEQLSCDVTFYQKDIDEYYPIKKLVTSKVTDILDKNHPYLVGGY